MGALTRCHMRSSWGEMTSCSFFNLQFTLKQDLLPLLNSLLEPNAPESVRLWSLHSCCWYWFRFWLWFGRSVFAMARDNWYVKVQSLCHVRCSLQIDRRFLAYHRTVAVDCWSFSVHVVRESGWKLAKHTAILSSIKFSSQFLVSTEYSTCWKKSLGSPMLLILKLKSTDSRYHGRTGHIL